MDHSYNIIASTGMKTLALMQGAWATILQCKPRLSKGDWIIYLNRDNPSKNTLWEGRGQVIACPKGPKAIVVIEWYKLNPATGTFIHALLLNRQS
jgi:hypothetical protein